MKSAQIVLTIVKEFRNRKFWLWILVLTISATGPLLGTYVFSEGIAALETNKTLSYALLIFFLYFTILGVEAVFRIGSKTKIHAFLETAIVSIEKNFVTKFTARDKSRRKVIQATRNLTDAINVFSTHFINTGISGLVSFITVPLLLLFIDVRIFILEILLMTIYLTGTYLFGKKYERQFENYDAAKENYFTTMFKTNNFEKEAGKRVKQMELLQNIRFFEWASLQNLILFFKFLVVFIVTIDIFNGLKNISDLVLIVGYTNQSQNFLNSVTGVIERFMEVVAGVDRLVIVTHRAPKGSVTKIA